MCIAKHTPLCVFIILGIVYHTQRVLTFRVSTKSLSVFPVLCIDGEVGVELQSVLKHSTWSIYALSAVDSEVLANNYFTVKELIVGICTTRKTIEPTVLDGALVAIVAQREERATFF